MSNNEHIHPIHVLDTVYHLVFGLFHATSDISSRNIISLPCAAIFKTRSGYHYIAQVEIILR